MRLKHLYLQNFRNYERAEFRFEKNINLIQGRNGIGKTNLLEAIHLLSVGRSFRTPALKELIKEGSAGFFIEGCFEKNDIEQMVTMRFDGLAKSLQIDGTTSPNFSSVLGLIPSVLFAPADHALIAGAPTERRRLLNLHIAQTDSLYLHHLMRYTRALKQRNCLLRTASVNELAIWEAEMAPSSQYIVEKRTEAIQRLSTRLPKSYDLTYKPSIQTDFLAHWKAHQARDLERHCTAAGPHRDELLIKIHQMQARQFASEGQKRAYLAALRLAQWQELKEKTKSLPLMSIDDFGVHLDHNHSERLGIDLQALGQVFLTTALDHLPIQATRIVPNIKNSHKN